MPTSDGITDEDWDLVADLAEAVVNQTGLDLDPLLAKRRLIYNLDSLESKYGRLPSILSTKADYVDDRDIQLSLLKEAYAGACEINDLKNKVFICGSLVEVYIDALERSKAEHWLEKLREALVDYPDSYFQRLYFDFSSKW